MRMSHKLGKLQIEPEALHKSTLFWTVQKIVVVFLIVFLIGVFFGLTGPGILGPNIIGDKNGPIWLSYDRFARANAPSKLQLTINPSQQNSTNKTIEVFFSASYLANVEIKQIIPTPLSSENKGENIVFTFTASNTKNIITFLFEPHKSGSQNATVQVIGAPTLRFKQFIYP
jgi:hypothetical protein